MTLVEPPATRCDEHQAQAAEAKNARNREYDRTRRKPRGTTSQRGLGWDWTKRKRADPQYQAATTCQCPGCPYCETGCGRAFGPGNPKTGDHVIPRSQGGRDGPILAMCLRCNSARGGQLRRQA